MLNRILTAIDGALTAPTAHAHCDGPCGVYDPASMRIAAEAAVSMTKKLLALELPAPGDAAAAAKYNNTFGRFVAIKEEEAHTCKQQMLVLWTDYFKPPHLEAFPDLHEVFWNATKECSSVKVELSLQHAENLMAHVEKIHNMFWESKGKSVPFVTVS